MIRSGMIVGASWIACALCAVAQPAFEAASVKPAASGGALMKGPGEPAIAFSPNGVTMRNVTLKAVITAAYSVKDFQVSGPSLLNSDRYEILAKASGPASGDQLKLMLQALLADRFKLALHRETKDLAIFALTIGKNEPKLQKAQPGGDSKIQINGGKMVFQNYSTSKLADFLSARSPDRPVQDATGLTGFFDFTAPLADGSDDPVEVKRAMELASRDGSFAAMIAERIGFKLEARKRPVEILVIDHAEKASEN